MLIVLCFSYQVRIDVMLLKEEFANTIGWIGESLDTVIVTAQDMMESKELQQILYLVLLTGNFLNAVSTYCSCTARTRILYMNSSSVFKLSHV